MKPLRTLSHVLFASCLAIGLFASPSADATMMIKLTTEQLTDASDYIVRGTVSSITSSTDDNDHIWTHVTINVTDRLKGPSDLQTLTLDVQGGMLGSRVTAVPLSPRFAMGEEVLTFAEVLESGRTMVTGMMQGKYTVRIAPEDGREMVVRYTLRQDRHYDPRFIPHPAPQNRVYAKDLKQQIRTRKASGWDGATIPGKSTERLKTMHPGVKALEVSK